MLNGGNYIDSWRHILWAEVANMVILLENCIFKINNEKSTFQQFFRKEETKAILLSLKEFGEKCIVMKQENLKTKHKNHAIPFIWLRYADSHAIDTYHKLNSKIMQVMFTEDAVF